MENAAANRIYEIGIEQWDDFQYGFLGANGLTNVTNAGRAKITGVESYVEWAATDQLRLSAGATWLEPELDQNFCQAILPWTYDDAEPPLTTCPDYLFARKGTQLPASPTFKGNVIGRYSFTVGGFDADVQGSYVYQNEVETDILPFNGNTQARRAHTASRTSRPASGRVSTR